MQGNYSLKDCYSNYTYKGLLKSNDKKMNNSILKWAKGMDNSLKKIYGGKHVSEKMLLITYY